MGAWVITVGAIALLTLLCDSILPDGSTKKYVKTVLGVIVSFVIVSSIIGAITNISLDFQQTVYSFNVQESYLVTAQLQRQEEMFQTVYQIAESCNVAIIDQELQEDSIIIYVDGNVGNAVQFENYLKLLDYPIVIVWSE